MLQAVVDPAECIWLGSLVLGGSDRPSANIFTILWIHIFLGFLSRGGLGQQKNTTLYIFCIFVDIDM